MTVKIYVEGGGDNKDTIVRCRQGFAEYCRKVVAANRQPRIIACGGRQQAFDRFMTELRRGKPGERYVLLVDSEGPVMRNLSAEAYLGARDGWVFPVMHGHKVFLMVQAMEAWLLADRDALRAFYGPKFHANALPGVELHVEAISKDDLEPSLANASRTTTKGRYHKTKHAFTLLGAINPANVERGSAHAAEFHEFLRLL